MKAIGKFFKVLFKILYTLRLIPAMMTVIYALVLKLMKISFSEASGYIVMLYILAAFSVLYFVYGVVKPFVGGKKPKPPKPKKFEAVPQPAPVQTPVYYDNGYYQSGGFNGAYQQPQQAAPAPAPRVSVQKKYPVYYKAAQNENYVFAEYEDRYELFLKTDGGLKYIKTDYKDSL